jgi:hypothetical protein
MSAQFRQLVLGAGSLLGLLFGTHSAFAFCQATSCNPTETECSTTPLGCFSTGLPLSWASNCVTVSVQADGAPKQHISYAAARSSVERAFAAWTHAACDGGPPSISVVVDGPVACGASEYNADRSNANIVVFREDAWPYVGGEDALGLTVVRFDPASGEIWDVDIEVNAVDEPLSVGAPVAGSVDLDSLLTHEAGHLLGLGHNTLDSSATMFPGYHAGSVELRTLADDDVEGICAVYPPNRKASSSSCEPRHGFSDICGELQPAPTPPSSDQKSSSCSYVAGSPPRPGFRLGLLAAFALLVGRRVRASKR